MGSFQQHLTKGGEFLRQDRVSDARDEFIAALRERPDEPQALARLGLAYFRLSSFAEALPVFEKLVELDPNDASFWLNLGLVHLKLGNAEQALDGLTRSRDLDPSQTRTVSYIGLAYARAGNYAEAFASFLRAGQQGLAKEMEQHLTAEERAHITAQVNNAAQAWPGGSEPGTRPLAEVPPVEEAPADESSPSPFVAALQQGATAEESDDLEPPATTPRYRKPHSSEHEFDHSDADEEVGFGEPEEEGGYQTPGMVTQVIHAASIQGADSAVMRAAVGHRPPATLSEFATSRLIRPEDGEYPFELGAGGVLIVRVNESIFSRTERVIVSGGDIGYETATRRVRGTTTDEPFGDKDHRIFEVTGRGYLVASPDGQHFNAVHLDDDILYVREELLYAFEPRLGWENGHIPGADTRIRIVQFRGTGSLAVKTVKPLLSVKLSTERALFVDADVLAGWVGRVVPRFTKPAAGGASSRPFVECSGEGVVLLEDPGLTGTLNEG